MAIQDQDKREPVLGPASQAGFSGKSSHQSASQNTAGKAGFSTAPVSERKKNPLAAVAGVLGLVLMGYAAYMKLSEKEPEPASNPSATAPQQHQRAQPALTPPPPVDEPVMGTGPSTVPPRVYPPNPVRDTPATHYKDAQIIAVPQGASGEVPNQSQAYQSIMTAFFQARAGQEYVSETNQAHIVRKTGEAMANVAQNESHYGNVYEQNSRERVYIAAAALDPDKSANAFICTQQQQRMTTFVHAEAKLDESGAYKVTISDEVRHAGYLKGLNLMNAFQIHKGCERAMKALNNDLNGSAEFAAMNARRTLHIR